MLKDQVECGLLRVHTNHILERVVRGAKQAAGASVKTDENDQVERSEAEMSPYQAWFSPQQDAVTQVSHLPQVRCTVMTEKYRSRLATTNFDCSVLKGQ